MRRTRGKTVVPGNEIPDDCSQESAENDIFIDTFEFHKSFADSFGDMDIEEERSDQIEECGPRNRFSRGENVR